jgi:hypothetical protein
MAGWIGIMAGMNSDTTMAATTITVVTATAGNNPPAG